MIEHPSVREAMKLLDFRERIEIVSLADVPASTGLGIFWKFYRGTVKRTLRTQEDHKNP